MRAGDEVVCNQGPHVGYACISGPNVGKTPGKCNTGGDGKAPTGTGS